MKKIILSLIGCFSMLLSTVTMASTEQDRRLEYSLTALDSVTTLWHSMEEVNGNWSASVSQPFVDGVADTRMDLSWGPALYRAWVNWEDSKGNALFSSYGSIKQISAGVNYIDFPMYISYWRNVSIKLPPGVTSNSEIWINGSRAWTDGTFWYANISSPWNVTKLTVVWNGHGQWELGTNPAFNYGQLIAFRLSDLDTQVTSPAQAFGISYLGETSWPEQQVVSVKSVEYDQTIGSSVLVCENTLYAGYGSFRVMVSLQYYDAGLGDFVQYLNQYITVTDGMFMVPLIDNNGGNLAIPAGTAVRFVYEDPADGGVVKQQWDYKIYFQVGDKG